MGIVKSKVISLLAVLVMVATMQVTVYSESLSSDVESEVETSDTYEDIYLNYISHIGKELGDKLTDIGKSTKEIHDSIMIKFTPKSESVVADPRIHNANGKSYRLGKRSNACNTKSYFYSYMAYTAPRKGSKQYKLLRGPNAKTNKKGVRQVGEYVAVALAKQYGPIGSKYLVTFSDGTELLVIKGDEKSSKQTSCTHPDGSMIEFIIDNDKLPSYWKRVGNLSGLIFDHEYSSVKITPTYFDEILD